MTTPAVSFRNVDIVFGDRPAKALPLIDQGLSREEINTALHNVSVDTVMGNLEFDDDGELKVAPSYLYMVKDGAFTLIGQTLEQIADPRLAGRR